MKALSIAIAAATTASILAMFVVGALAQPVGSLDEQVGWEELNTGVESSPNGWATTTLQFTNMAMRWSPFGSGPLNMVVTMAKGPTQPDGCAEIVVWVDPMDKSLPGAMERREGSIYLCHGEKI